MDGGTFLDPKAQRVKRKDEIDSDSDDDDDVTQAYSFSLSPVRIPRGALAASQATIGSQPGALLAPSQVRWLPARCVVGSLPGSLSLSPSLSLYLIFHTRTYS